MPVVLQYNRTDDVKTKLPGQPPYDSLDYTYDNYASVDPAPGCEKEFVTKYQCGLSPLKTLTLPKPAQGTASYDCKTETTKCMVQLNLDDSGMLSITNSTKTSSYWTSQDLFTIADPSKTVQIDEWNPTSTKYKGKVFTNATSAPVTRSYLKAGEFLANNEFIGSPSGKYRLHMANGALRIEYKGLGCDAAPNSSSFRVNTITPAPASTVGKLGYVNNTGQLMPYPTAMTTYIAAYESVGPYDLTIADLETTSTIATDLNACKARCTGWTGTKKCAGIIFDKTSKMCQLKDDTIYTAKRILSNSKEYHMRLKDATGNDDSCPNTDSIQTPLPIDAERWQSMTPGSTMTATTKCGLFAYTANEQQNVAAANSKLTTNLNTLKGTSDAISGKLAPIKAKLATNLADLTTKITSFKDYQKEKDFTGAQLKQLNAMSEDSEMNMLSQNYQHILWSILAIMIVLGIIKFSRPTGA
jgi:hypothetical protein